MRSYKVRVSTLIFYRRDQGTVQNVAIGVDCFNLIVARLGFGGSSNH